MSIKKSDKLLVGLPQICEFTGLSRNTILKMHKKVRFPMKKLEGTWYSHTQAIEEWMYSECREVPSPKRVKRKN